MKQFFLVAVLNLVPLQAAEIVVSTSGSDQAAGTMEAPFRTLQRAYAQAGPGDTIVLRGGIYREAVSVKNKAGREGAPITLTAYPGEKPVLSGLDVQKLEWKASAQAQVYVAGLDVNSLAQLFFNGKPMLEARWPNAPRDANGDWNFFSKDAWAVVDPQGNSYGTISDRHLAATRQDVTGAQAVLNVGPQFFTFTRPVKQHSAGSPVFHYDKDLGPSLAKHDEAGSNPLFNDDRYYLFGMRQFLDAPGEWFYDAAEKQLYFYAPGGGNPSAGVVEIKTRPWGFVADENSAFLTIEGIEFFATAFQFGRDPNHKTSHIVFRNNAVLRSSWTEYIGVTGMDPVYPTIEADQSAVVNNTFAWGAVSGLYINGFDNLVENNVFHDFCYSSSLTYPPLQVSRATAAMVGKAGRATVRQNTLYRSGGIQAQVAQEGNQVYLNELRDSFLACYGGNKDTSALYTQNTFCSGTRLHHNWVHGAYSGTPPLPWGGGMGIRGDDKTSGLTVDHNVVWDLGAPGIMIKSVDEPTPDQANRCVNNTVFHHSGYNNVKGGILIQSAAANQNVHSTVLNNLSDSIFGGWFAAPMGKLKQFSNNVRDFDPARDLVNAGWLDFRPVPGARAIVDSGVAVEGLTGAFVGKAPDAGAYERGDLVYWIPGHREAKASAPIVPDQVKNVPVDRDVLMWKPAYQAAGHTVYFATSKADLAGRSLRKSFRGEENIFPLPKLVGGKAYYWRVDALMPDGSVVVGDVWSFTTK